MPIFPYQRITSSGPVTTAASGDTAENALLSGVGGVPAVPVTNPFPLWPSVNFFDNDNHPTFTKIDPAVIWSKSTADPGEKVGFAAQSNIFGINASALGANFIIGLAVFGDNAVTARVRAFNTLGITAPVLPPLFPVADINFTLAAGQTVNPNPPENTIPGPYNWQKIRYYTVPISTGVIAGVGINLRFVFTFEALNYINITPTNPGGIAFVADIYGDVPVLPPIVPPPVP